jgi:hypothetical protein
VRRVIYATNAIESIHAQLPKIIKTTGRPNRLGNGEKRRHNCMDFPGVCRTLLMVRNWQREVIDGNQDEAAFHC